MKKLITPSNYEVIPLDARTNVCFYTSVDSGSYVPPHWHDAIEIVYLQKGDLKINTEGASKKLEAGQCILIQPNTVHSTLCTHPNRAIVFQIPAAFMEKYLSGFAELTFQLDEPPAVTTPADKKLHHARAQRLKDEKLQYATLQQPEDEELQQAALKQLKKDLEKMQFIMDSEPDGALLQFNSVLFDVLYQLYHNFSTRKTASGNSHLSRNLERLKPILNYINNNYNQPISLEEISQVAMLDSKYFCRFFKKCMGTTFLEYQNHIRLSHIYQDLISTDDKIGDILERHGFTNYKLFRRMFFQHFGCTPTEVRRKISCTF